MGAVHATLYMDNCCRIITAAMASLTPAVCSGVAVPVGSCACCDYRVKTKHNETGEVERCGEQIGAGRSIETIEIKSNGNMRRGCTRLHADSAAAANRGGAM